MIARWIFVREGRLSRRGKLALAGMFVAALMLLLPMRLALGAAAPARVSARSVEGSIWGAQIADLRAGPLPLGTVTAGLNPLALLLGRAQFVVQRAEAPDVTPFRASASGSGETLRLAGVSGTVPLGEGLGGLPVTALGFTDFSLRMEQGRCAAADGMVSMTLASLSPLLPGEMALAGKARCHKGVLVVPMQGPGGMEKLLLRIRDGGQWEADLSLSGLPVEVSGPLLEAGFSARPGGVGLRTSGKF